jgi:SpoVK/Ycf46/Vps4 family AAA+-type ATPase
VMVDCASYNKMNPNTRHPFNPCTLGNACNICRGQPGTNCTPHADDQLGEVPEEKLHMCSATVFGYSFVHKLWGRFVVNKFSPIKWDKAAYKHLVLDETTKELIKALVEADREDAKMVGDIITGKGGGCIVILHGRPGTGKTLTAEAIAEEEEKPLMVISVADLGIDAYTLEKNLRNILEISKLWDAVILIDEADVFLEARSLHELARNAMVGVFLRLLEYHQRLIFLTTNRVITLDEAFKSRISVAIKYPDLDKIARRQIWKTFLTLAGIRIIDSAFEEDLLQPGSDTWTWEEVDKVASRKLNGRYVTQHLN